MLTQYFPHTHHFKVRNTANLLKLLLDFSLTSTCKKKKNGGQWKTETELNSRCYPAGVAVPTGPFLSAGSPCWGKGVEGDGGDRKKVVVGAKTTKLCLYEQPPPLSSSMESVIKKKMGKGRPRERGKEAGSVSRERVLDRSSCVDE